MKNNDLVQQTTYLPRVGTRSPGQQFWLDRVGSQVSASEP